MPIRVVLACDREVTAAGLRAVLDPQPDIAVVALEAPDRLEQALVAHRPDVVVVDRPAGDHRVVRVAQRILLERATAVVVLFPVHATPAAPPGPPVLAVIHQDEPASRVISAVRRAAVGMATHSDLPQDVGQGLARLAELTEREWEVLAALTEGLGPQAIAERLVLSVHTARNHLRSIMAKLGTSTQVETVAMVLRLRLAEHDDDLRGGVGFRLPGGGR